MEINIEGIFAAEDIVNFKGKVKLISEAPIAVNCAKAYIGQEARILPLHSTNPFSSQHVEKERC